MPDTAPYYIRPLQRADRAAVRAICIQTAWCGRPPGEQIPDEWIWAEYWTRFFTDRERDCSWVACRRDGDRGVVGYLTGTADEKRFARYVPWLLPGFVGRVIRKRLISRRRPRRALTSFGRSLLAGEMHLPPGVAEAHPATCHVDLLPEARRRGLGTRMFELFLARLRERYVPGVHLQTLSVNRPIHHFCLQARFRLAARRQLHAFCHVDPDPIEILTWVLSL